MKLITNKTLDAQTAGILILQKEIIEINYYDQDKNDLKKINVRLTGYSPISVRLESLTGENLSFDFARIKSIVNVQTQISLHIGDKEIIYKQSAGGGYGNKP